MHSAFSAGHALGRNMIVAVCDKKCDGRDGVYECLYSVGLMPGRHRTGCPSQWSRDTNLRFGLHDFQFSRLQNSL